MVNGQIVCPQCRRSDLVFRLGDLVAQETLLVTKREPASETTIKLQSKRAYQFQQALEKEEGCLTELLMIPLGLLGTLAMIIGVLVVLAGCMAFAMAALVFLTGDPDTAIEIALFGISLFAGIAVFIGGPMVVSGWIGEKTEKRKRDRWEKLYYCERCDGVFAPGQHRLTPVERIRSLM